MRNIDVDIPLGKLTVVTGPSGSGKTSLAIHTLYAEGQRRYMETFSPYVRQFMDRMSRPDLDSMENILPAIALHQHNSIRTSRSTVGTMTGLNEYWKLIFSRLSVGRDPETGRIARPDTPATVYEAAIELWGEDAEVLVVFEVPKPQGVPDALMFQNLREQGYLRYFADGDVLRVDESGGSLSDIVLVVQDRVKVNAANRQRMLEAVESSMRLGKNIVYLVPRKGAAWGDKVCFRGDWYPLMEPVPALFSSNSPLGACPHCKGYGRLISIDYDKAITPGLSLKEGAVNIFEGRMKPCKKDLLNGAKRTGKTRVDVPWKDLTDEEREWVMTGETDDWKAAFESGEWYGIRGFFRAMESDAHKMLVRIWLSHYRVYTLCPYCRGSRLRPEALQFTINGKTLPDLQAMPMSDLLPWIEQNVAIRDEKDHSLKHAVAELKSRVEYLNHVGLGYISTNRLTRSLSGGEIERVSLTTCLGASLTDTLFVLDEPTVGLHPRDTGKLIASMERLKNRGNTLVVVEHEEAVMRSADNLIDMGPGSGANGGELVFSGRPDDILQYDESVTGRYLSGKLKIGVPQQRRKPKNWLHVKKAVRHNLNGLDIDIPLGVYACLTGVSGSGKSTLANDVVYLNYCKENGIDIEDTPAEVAGISGWEHIDEVLMVDQSPLIRTPRSTPAVYVGVYADVRTLFSKTDAAVSRGLKPGFFSFNNGEGRCPRCSGMGSEKIEMQFLSDLFVTCPLCEGKRFGQEALGIQLNGKNISDILGLTIQEGRDFFASIKGAAAKRIVEKLDFLLLVGLGHLGLGQPLNTLSGGENQRLKLCKILLDQTQTKGAVKRKGKLIILDEPGTGLHFSDLEVLLKLFQTLVEAGHSLLVIEHNLELIKAADYILDLGPEGGNEGGRLVMAGTPEQIVEAGKAYTPIYLKEVLEGKESRFVSNDKAPGPLDDDIPAGVIALRGARHHNLKDIDVDVKRGDMTVLTGLSGSGKSSIAFDIFFAEGQRRFMDVMSPYARQFTEQLESPDIDRLTGLPPTVAIEQNMSRGGSKSTVGTVTEIWQFLRLMYAKLGQPYCPKCQIPVGKRSEGEVVEMVGRLIAGHDEVSLMAPLVKGRKGHYADLARWAVQKGYKFLWIDNKWTPLDEFEPLDRYSNHDIDLVTAQLSSASLPADVHREVLKGLELGEGFLHVLTKGADKPVLLGTKLACPKCSRSFEALEPSTFSYNSPRGWCPDCYGHGFVSTVKIQEEDRRSALEAELRYDKDVEKALDPEEEVKVCPSCRGGRLNPFAANVRLQNLRPAELSKFSTLEARDVISTWRFSGRDEMIARDSLSEIIQRLDFLDKVGLGYLSLDRSATTLSGGETQRIRLASQLGSRLRGILYILDEPTIGLHPKDNERLLNSLDDLKNRGNTLLVVEHDEDTMKRADRIIDLGPGAGINGGRIVADGQFEQIKTLPDSVTGFDFHQKPKHPYRGSRRKIPAAKNKSEWLTVTGCRLHNLKDITVSMPKNRLIVLTGVSGAGKTTLMNETIRYVVRDSLGDRLGREKRNAWDSSSGFDAFRMVYVVDQSPIGKTPRSTPATYVGFFDDIRTLFSQTEDAKRLGFEKGRFSFNTNQGRCELCKGTGMEKLEMDFLPPGYVHCQSCRGRRYNSAPLSVRYQGKNIADVLEMNFEQAAEFFEAQPRIAAPLQLLVDTGLGYLTLGQASNTLSGGESQRLKLVTELIRGFQVHRNAVLKGKPVPQDLYLIEEPSIGLHPHDVRRLVDVLHRLVDQGHTVMVIEHNTEIMGEADYIIDMGPGPGDEGGRIVAAGTPEQVAKKDSPTAPFIREELKG